MTAATDAPHEDPNTEVAYHLKKLTELPVDDRESYWRTHVYRGNVQQLTVRGVIMGMLLGGVLSVSNLYVGLKIGWGFGVTITAGILAFAIFRALEKVLPGGHFTDLENNAMQSTASAAGAMSSAGLVSAVPALLLLNGQSIPSLWLAAWVGAISLLGVVVAIPLKRQMINIDQLPFPSGIAAAETIRSLHGEGDEAVKKARILGYAALLGAFVAYFKDAHTVITTKLSGAVHLGMGLKPKLLALALPEAIHVPGSFRGVVWEKLTTQFNVSLLLYAAGAIIGMRTGISVLVGAVLNWWILAPWLIANKIEASGKVIEGGFRGVVAWSTWPGTSMMVIATLVAVAFQWKSLARGFAGITDIFRPGAAAKMDAEEAAIEVPGSWFLWGFGVAAILCVWLQWQLFGIHPALGVMSVLLAAVLSMVATRVSGETDIAPLGAMGKVTQFCYAAISPGSAVTNLMAANVTAGAASHTSDLLTDLKSGYLLGAKPRQQFLAQLFGVAIGTLVCVPVYNILVPNASVLGDKFAAPAAMVWKATAEVLAKGLSTLPPTAMMAAAIAIAFTVIWTLLEQLVPAWRRIPLSPTGVGLAFILPFSDSFAIFFGALVAWAFTAKYRELSDRYLVTISSGIIAGESIMAVVIIAVFKLMGEV